MILAIETATRVCSVALKTDEEEVLERRTEEYGEHSERLFEFIKSLQQEAEFRIGQLKACLISEGPGSYTGLRIGASGVKGLLYGTKISLFAGNTLASMAWSVHDNIADPATVHAVVDARRHHLYHQRFSVDENIIDPKNEADIRSIDELNEEIKRGDFIVGTGWERLNQEIVGRNHGFGPEYISARHLINLYETEIGKRSLNERGHKDSDALIRQVRPDQFDPKYITSKKPGT